MTDLQGNIIVVFLFAIVALPGFCLARNAIRGLVYACATLAVFNAPFFLAPKHVILSLAVVPEPVAGLLLAWLISVSLKKSWRLIRQRNKRA